MPGHGQPRGFTLVELLVVIGIIGLLLTLLVPTISKATETVRTYRTRTILKDLSIGLNSFKIDFGDYPPSKPRVPLPGLGLKSDPASGEAASGAGNLVVYLRGPNSSGWGMAAGGQMPFGGVARRTYGPYYQCPEESVRTEVINNTLVPGGFLDGYQPPGIILYFRSSPTTIKDSSENYVIIQTFDATDCNRTDKPNKPELNYVPPGGLTQKTLFDNLTGVFQTSTGSTAAQLVRYKRQDYILISPGVDGKFGYIDKETLLPCTSDSTNAQNDDIANF
jgi:prepilin-type N-terminal cleavage/methylation domain-containing protein